jgi:phosphoribosylformylglycinamidine synthase
MIERFYRQVDTELEHCFYVESDGALDSDQRRALSWLLAETFEPERFGRESFLSLAGGGIVEIGPRLNFETAWR